MTYRSLLVFLDRDPLCAARTQVAIQLANVLDCHLVGLAPVEHSDLSAFSEAVTSATESAAQEGRDAPRNRAEQTTEQFRSACRAGGVKSFEAVIEESDKAPSLVRHAHCSDLIILSQANPSAPGHREARDLVERVVLHSARPTLILPYAGHFDTVSGNVLVAWDDSREAARALSDALPLLRLAKHVRVVSWNQAGADDDEMALRPRLDALNQWLKWQGVAAEVRVETTEIDIADAMLSFAADMETNLIVMGAYGHSRWAERILGGATRGLLATMTVPVLMAH